MPRGRSTTHSGWNFRAGLDKEYNIAAPEWLVSRGQMAVFLSQTFGDSYPQVGL